MLMTAFGNMQKSTAMLMTIPYESFMIRFTSDITLSSLPAPMMLLTSVLQVDENAASIIQSRPDTPLMMLDTARDLSPRCSM